uniref:Developmentally-regulated G-protein 1 n=1 Tax=Nicotiana tabacum TaxID=4097 RepID=A0A1S3XMR2_TOBAC|nr:PREDICTED: developmentally-regulated G-protein 1-like [Nicotiana tabacum]
MQRALVTHKTIPELFTLTHLIAPPCFFTIVLLLRAYSIFSLHRSRRDTAYSLRYVRQSILPLLLVQIYFKKKKTWGISFNSTLLLTHIDEKFCYQILHEYRIHNAELNLDRLLAKMWEEMGLCIVYAKPQDEQPDFEEPMVLSANRGGCIVEDFCNHIHRSLVKDVKYVLVWATSPRPSALWPQSSASG